MNDQKRVLVCDDDEGISELLEAILEENGYSVRVLRSGKEVLKVAEEFSPDMILLDLWMPGVGGVEATKLLKKEQKFKETPVLIISALNDIDKVIKDCGADGFITKPFDMLEFLETVKKYTDK